MSVPIKSPLSSWALWPVLGSLLCLLEDTPEMQSHGSMAMCPISHSLDLKGLHRVP